MIVTNFFEKCNEHVNILISGKDATCYSPTERIYDLIDRNISGCARTAARLGAFVIGVLEILIRIVAFPLNFLVDGINALSKRFRSRFFIPVRISPNDDEALHYFTNFITIVDIFSMLTKCK